ncbi:MULTISPECIES: putative quinol monooxygenase [Nocardiaceae]|jgi:quinol monooxygenase YgiN|uniref:putative quinol monooxygenase n=1 Tax=Nocardiaceae TaxID=85025 RepID=UPI000561B530|nr:MULTISPECIES: antibiotic biosynthesis monooxygenase [Rhodococcus]OZF03509.1 antibiotic biosynthesis monooxygenase [Rhodococcus sp. 15-1189-1-1a]OZF17312.1 antibiotic biosynthesis monooxygenase [Rhodococcus sp. 14-2686-1-2]OZF54855.1 antibiotic biosynthesis monooxygenase [Rhodococcus sp. 14-2470-1b]OZF54989.1 antibiotic biosynthesis monooxygenase [Rhodococcus sp. 14-2470-1b]
MTLVALLDVKLKPEALDEGKRVLGRVLAETRAFDGCLGVDVLVDSDDETHWIAYERWESAEADAKYREFRAGPGKTTELGALLAAAPGLTKYTVSDI